MRRRIVLFSLLLVIILPLTLWSLLRGSLPQLDGEITLPGLSAPVAIQRDALGVVTIDAHNQHDAVRALGFVHAQERYFEMDLMRRTSAGELAALFGPVALGADRHHRVHRMRARVREGLDTALGTQTPQVDAYAEGVNAGLAALRVRPWPYLLLRQLPEAWTPEDSLLAGYAMYFDLQDSRNRHELALWQLRPHLPPALHALLAHDGSRWDAPMRGGSRGDAILPGADEVDLRTLPANTATATISTATSDHLPGSNNFAVVGALTGDGRAIVANDMHLSLRAPNIWFRARLHYPDPDAPGGQVDVQGFTLPGLPAVIVGSNGQVAWGFTNSYLDSADWKVEAADHPRLHTHLEQIEVAGRAPETFAIRESTWGPVLHELPDRRVLSLRWLAHLPGALNLQLAEFARARDPARAAFSEDFTLRMPEQFEGVAWPLVSQRPAHLLPPTYPNWPALFEDAATEVLTELRAQAPLNQHTWGEANTAAICHPLSTALPRFAKSWLCMPPDPLPGDGMMARVQSPAFGASERMVVSPGREAEGFIHMPGGQSGHLLSPFWGAGHDDWVHARPTPFLPGPAVHTLTAQP